MLHYTFKIKKPLFLKYYYVLFLFVFAIFLTKTAHSLSIISDDPINFFETAVAFQDIGDYEAATEYYLIAIKLYLNIDKKEDVVSICERLADLAFTMGNYEQAATYINSAYLITVDQDSSKADYLLKYLHKICLEGELSEEDIHRLSYGPINSIKIPSIEQYFTPPTLGAGK